MTDADDTLVDLVDLDHFERLFEEALAPGGPGEPPGADDRPTWVDDLAHLVAEARSGPTDDELRASTAVVAAMATERQRALSRARDLSPGDQTDELDELHGAVDIDDLDEHYSPQHIAQAPPPTPAGRQVRRVIAVKAVAVVTAVAVGTVAAAAATTGIVSSVVERVTQQQAPPGIDGTPDDEPADAADSGTEGGGTIDVSRHCPEVEALCSPVHGRTPARTTGDDAAPGATDPLADGSGASDPGADDASATAPTDGTVTTEAVEPAETTSTNPTTSTSTTATTTGPTTTTTQPGPSTPGDDTLPPQARENRNERAGLNGRR